MATLKQRVILMLIVAFSYMLGIVLGFIGGTQHPDCNFFQWFTHATYQKWNC